jgi:hypothetical protein
VWTILAHHFGEVIHRLRFEDPLHALDHSQWWVLVCVAHSWTRGDKSPSQADLARWAGLSTRTVRRSLVRLEELDLLRGVRDNGSTTELDVGPRLAPILRDIVTSVTPANGTYVSPSLIKKKEEDLNSFCSERTPTPATPAAPAMPATPATPGQLVDAATARRLALDALAIRFRRAHVGIPLPRTCDAADVKLVEACTANGTWDVETLRQTHLDAIEGAFEKAAPDRPPTPRYIWGQFRFFLAHASVGRAKRLRAGAPPKAKKARPPEDPPASFAWLEQHMREASARLATLPAAGAR